MALMPKRVKHRKSQRGRIRGNATRGNRVVFGDFGLQALHGGWLSAQPIEAGRIAAIDRQRSPMAGWTFALRAPRAEWELFWKPVPPPGSQDIFAMLKRRVLRIEGNLQPLWANMFYFKDLLAKPRLAAGGA